MENEARKMEKTDGRQQQPDRRPSGLDVSGLPFSLLRTALMLVPGLLVGCTPTEPNALANMPTASMSIKDQAFQVWIADEGPELTRGLMFITKEEMAPLADGTERGMLFVFSHDQTTGFWMRNTIIPLDIAFIRADGTIVTIHTMAPYDERSYMPSEPYRYALEVNANVYSRLGIHTGAQVQIPESVLKGSR